MRPTPHDFYASYIAHILRWSFSVHALLSVVLLSGSGSLIAMIVTQLLRRKVVPISNVSLRTPELPGITNSKSDATAG